MSKVKNDGLRSPPPSRAIIVALTVIVGGGMVESVHCSDNMTNKTGNVVCFKR